MFPSHRFLRIFGADPERWAKRFSLEPFAHPCIDCGAPRSTTIPFAFGSLRGLIAPTCTCGNDQPPYCIVRVGRDLLDPR